MPVKLDGLEKDIPKIDTAAVSIKIGTDVVLDVTLGMKVRLATYSMGTDSNGTEAVGFGFEPAD